MHNTAQPVPEPGPGLPLRPAQRGSAGPSDMISRVTIPEGVPAPGKRVDGSREDVADSVFVKSSRIKADSGFDLMRHGTPNLINAAGSMKAPVFAK